MANRQPGRPVCWRPSSDWNASLRKKSSCSTEAGHILAEYRRHLSPSGQPGTGDFFYRWIYEQAAHNPQHCEQVALALDEDGNFAAFPAVPELAGFDPSDRKFVAAARTHPANPPVVNATDTDWHEHQEALRQQGVRLEFVCPAEMLRPGRA